MKKKNLSTIALLLIFLTGLSLLLYPSVSNAWNTRHQSRAIAAYTTELAAMDHQTYDALWAEARAYNRQLLRQD